MAREYSRCNFQGFIMIQMLVEGIGIDPQNQTLVLLRDEERRVFVPIYIGPAEAMAIQTELDSRPTPRPMTHDLISNILRDLQVELVKVTVKDVDKMLYYATLHLRAAGAEQEVDARPSDAIALALRAHCQIWVSDEVIDKSGIQVEEIPAEEVIGEEAPAEIDKFARLIEGLDLGEDEKSDN
jgi:bifunctional DNase/RNase